MPDAPYPPVDVPAAEPPQERVPIPKIPTTRAPVGACDAHVHMLAGPGEHPLGPGRAGDPPDGSFEEWMAGLRAHLDILGCTRVVLVQSVLHGTGNAVTLDAAARLGGMARAVALVSNDATPEHLDALRGAGAVGVWVNRVHGGPLDWGDLPALAPRLAERGMHVETLVHAGRHLPEMVEEVAALPVPVVFDHAGWPEDGAADPAHEGVEALCRLLARGRAWVKLSGLHRFTESPYEAADALVRRLVEANPERCVWGSDWPHLMLGEAARPDAGVLLDAFMRAVEGSQDRQRILVDNPAALYGF